MFRLPFRGIPQTKMCQPVGSEMTEMDAGHALIHPADHGGCHWSFSSRGQDSALMRADASLDYAIPCTIILKGRGGPPQLFPWKVRPAQNMCHVHPNP